MHGAFGGYGGYAGNEIEVAWNTFLPAESDNFDVRGQSFAKADKICAEDMC
jgi:hypothetical protein